MGDGKSGEAGREAGDPGGLGLGVTIGEGGKKENRFRSGKSGAEFRRFLDKSSVGDDIRRS